MWGRALVHAVGGVQQSLSAGERAIAGLLPDLLTVDLPPPCTDEDRRTASSPCSTSQTSGCWHNSWATWRNPSKDSRGRLPLPVLSVVRLYAVNNKPDVVYIRGKEQLLDSYTTEPTNYVQLLASIKHCHNVQRLQHLVTNYVDVFDAVHLAAAIAVLPKVLHYRPDDVRANDSVVTGAGVLPYTRRPGAQLRQEHQRIGAELAGILDQLVPRFISGFFPRQCATTVWAFGELAAKRVVTQFEHLDLVLMTLKRGDFNALRVHGNALDYAQLLKGLSHLQCDDQVLITNLAGLVADSVHTFRARELQMATRSLAHLGCTDKSVFDALADQALKHIPFFTPQGIAAMSWAFAKAGHMRTDLLDALARGLAPQVVLISPQDITLLAGAYSKLQYSNPEVMALLGDHAVDILEQFVDHGLAATLHGFAQLGVKHEKLLDAVARNILAEPVLGSMPSTLIRVLSAYAALDWRGSTQTDASALYHKLLGDLAPRAPKMEACDIAALCRAATALGEIHEGCMAAVTEQATRIITTFTTPQLLAVLTALNALQLPVSQSQFQLAVAAARHLGDTLAKQARGPHAVAMLVDCLYQARLQQVNDPAAAKEVLDVVQRELTGSVELSPEVRAKALMCAFKMSVADHPACQALEASAQQGSKQISATLLDELASQARRAMRE